MNKRLEDLDLKEVSEKTRIEIEFFQALLAKDFEELEKFNVRGFLKILNREYNIDLSDMLEEYEAFLNKDEEKIENEAKVVTNVDQYSKESSNWWLWLLIGVVLVAIIVLVLKFDLLKGFVNETNEESSSVAVVQTISEAQNNLEENNMSVENTEELNQIQTIIQEEENLSQNATTSTQTLNEAITSADEGLKKEAIFSTDGKVWVGFIDLETRTNSSIVTDNNFSVDLSKDQLLLIGGTALTLIDEKGEIQTFPAGNSKRFLVKDGAIKSITLSEFISYNKGKEW